MSCNAIFFVPRAGLSIVPVVPWEGAPSPGGPRSAAKFLPRCFDVWTLSVRLNVTMTTKMVVNFLWKKVHRQRKSWLRVREKGPRLTLVCPPPRMVNPALMLQQTVSGTACLQVVVVICLTAGSEMPGIRLPPTASACFLARKPLRCIQPCRCTPCKATQYAKFGAMHK